MAGSVSEVYENDGLVSECCGAGKRGDSDLCGYCYEHADFVQYTRYDMNKLGPNYDYAPSQKALGKWLRQVCSLD